MTPIRSLRHWSELKDEPVDLILVTGGLSVDPDDVTRTGIKKAGTKIIFYGTPVYRGRCSFTECWGKSHFWAFQPVFFTIR